MPFDATNYDRPNPLNLSPEILALFDELLAWLDKGGDDKCRFDYSHWMDNRGCGTAACIGGWFDWRTGFQRPGYMVGQRLGLNSKTEDALFYAIEPSGAWLDVTAPVAASCVRHMLTTGEVDWPRAFAVGGR